MKSKSIRHILRNERHCNPFSDSFDFAKLNSDINKYLCSVEKDVDDPDTGAQEDDLHAITIARATPIFHEYFMQFYEYIKMKMQEANIHTENLIKLITSFVNHDTRLMDLEFKKLMASHEEIRLENFASFTIQSSYDSFGEINALSSFEVQIDILNLLINYFKYFHKETETGRHNNFDHEEARNVSANMYAAANILFLVKDAYDRVLWEDGKIIEDADKLLLKYKEPNYQILQQIGLFRVQKNVLSQYVQMHEFLLEKPLSTVQILRNRKRVKLEKIEVNDRGFVSCSLKKGNPDVNELSQHIKGLSSLIAYYPHISNKTFKSLHNMTIYDLMTLHNELVYIAQRIANSDIRNNTTTNSQFLLRFKRKNLIEYFRKVTTYTRSQIEAYLQTIESDIFAKGRINLWQRPLIKNREVYYMTLPSLVAPNYLQLIDAWFEAVGYSLEERGHSFERFIKKELGQRLKDKGPYTIPQNNRFTVSKREFEEIDLVISFQDFILIAEVKNIKYPMEPRDNHNAIKRLKDGAAQIVRKKEFLIKYKDRFSKILNGLENKPIYNCVITNYPHYTGIQMLGVPIIDYMVFHNYMSSGEIGNMKVALNDSEAPELTKVNAVRLWNNRTEFSKNIENYLFYPVVVEQLKSKVSLHERRITLDQARPEIYIEFAEFLPI
ncbi:nuclease-related domain-containing protein [Paenibacillus popilliae]|uniref:NERD domain-containing protein n=1 Tax=Paenibacillus popilliae TaxID=78057 RepID=A0ABY3AH65_PAEPP|nr:nuclease-related domain-containing protein [Paenibacillus sp. SDF0028]TQR40045.1 NERD domain-containing protein [Paenibacillus sp. SDF0028]